MLPVRIAEATTPRSEGPGIGSIGLMGLVLVVNPPSTTIVDNFCTPREAPLSSGKTLLVFDQGPTLILGLVPPIGSVLVKYGDGEEGACLVYLEGEGM